MHEGFSPVTAPGWSSPVAWAASFGADARLLVFRRGRALRSQGSEQSGARSETDAAEFE
jgi:hypothetical protein